MIWLTYEQAAKRTARSLHTVERWVRNGMQSRTRAGRREIRGDHLLSWWRVQMRNEFMRSEQLGRVSQ